MLDAKFSNAEDKKTLRINTVQACKKHTATQGNNYAGVKKGGSGYVLESAQALGNGPLQLIDSLPGDCGNCMELKLASFCSRCEFF